MIGNTFILVRKARNVPSKCRVHLVHPYHTPRGPSKWISYHTHVSRIWSMRLGLQPISKCFVTQQMYTSHTSLHEAMLKCHILFKFWNLEAYFLKFSPRLKINSDVTLPSNHLLLSSKLESLLNKLDQSQEMLETWYAQWFGNTSTKFYFEATFVK